MTRRDERRSTGTERRSEDQTWRGPDASDVTPLRRHVGSGTPRLTVVRRIIIRTVDGKAQEPPIGVFIGTEGANVRVLIRGRLEWDWNGVAEHLGRGLVNAHDIVVEGYGPHFADFAENMRAAALEYGETMRREATK